MRSPTEPQKIHLKLLPVQTWCNNNLEKFRAQSERPLILLLSLHPGLKKQLFALVFLHLVVSTGRSSHQQATHHYFYPAITTGSGMQKCTYFSSRSSSLLCVLLGAMANSVSSISNYGLQSHEMLWNWGKIKCICLRWRGKWRGWRIQDWSTTVFNDLSSPRLSGGSAIKLAREEITVYEELEFISKPG